MKRISTITAALFMGLSMAMAQSTDQTSPIATNNAAPANQVATAVEDSDKAPGVTENNDVFSVADTEVELEKARLRYENQQNEITEEIVLGIVCGAVMPICIVIIALLFIYKSKKAKLELGKALVEKGMPLPDNFFGNSEPTIRYNSSISAKMHSGIKTTLIGLALTIFLFVFFDEAAFGCIGFIVIAVGLANIASAYYSMKTERIEEKGQAVEKEQAVAKEAEKAEEVKAEEVKAEEVKAENNQTPDEKAE